MKIEVITAKTGKHLIPDYPFSREAPAYRCIDCNKIWLKEKEANNHVCKAEEDSMELSDAIILLHNIARVVEKSVGQGQLSEDIRNCADRINTLNSPLSKE
jgi:hypothetical protein